MLQPVNDCYWLPKLKRDDVPITSTPRHVALPELKYCEVPDSVLCIVSTHITLLCVWLCSAILSTLPYVPHATSHYSVLLYATPRFSMLRCATL